MSACAGCLIKGGCGGAAFPAPFLLISNTGIPVKTAKPVSLSHGGGDIPGVRKISIWVLVADRNVVRLFKKDCGGDGFGEITPDAPADKIPPEKISGWLDSAARKNAFDRLVLIADGETLGQLHAILSHTVQSRIVAEVSQNLTTLPEKALQAELKKIVWF